MNKRHLVLCYDGTWQSEENEKDGRPAISNVRKLFNCLALPEECTYYNPGPGTHGSRWDKLLGGAFGRGLDSDIKSGYRWLADRYQPGDLIWLFGFSRGAYSARSLAGFIGAAGLLKTGATEQENWAMVNRAYEKCYRVPRDKRTDAWKKGITFHGGGEPIGIHFIGVWDTVGALGIPDEYGMLDWGLDRKRKHEFHDTTLSDKVAHARHAVALDERRASYTPTLWVNTEGREVKQLWFPGAHADVGGGYPESGLSDCALKWMIEEATDCGLDFKASLVKQIRPRYNDVVHNSYSGFFTRLRDQPRPVPLMLPNNPALHGSAQRRLQKPPINQTPYHPTLLLGKQEQEIIQQEVEQQLEQLLEWKQQHTVPVSAGKRWNRTCLYLEHGKTYRFEATGEWLDVNTPYGPAGGGTRLINAGGWVMGKLEGGFKRISGNGQADFWFTRRHEKDPWLCLMGAIANCHQPRRSANPSPDGTACPHESFAIGNGCTYKVKGPSGYLYCYANDTWEGYGNNRGHVTLTVSAV